MKKIKFLLTVLVLATVVTLTACSSSNPVEGEWRRVGYYIFNPFEHHIADAGINDIQLTYEVHEIIITETQLTYDGHVAIFEMSEDSNHLIVSSGWFQGSTRFEVEGNILILDGQTWFRVDSDEYNEHREAVEAAAEAELAGIVAEVEAAEAERLALVEANENAEMLLQQAFDELIGDHEQNFSDLEQRLEEEVNEHLNGEWVNMHDDFPLSGASRIETTTMTLLDGEVNIHSSIECTGTGLDLSNCNRLIDREGAESEDEGWLVVELSTQHHFSIPHHLRDQDFSNLSLSEFDNIEERIVEILAPYRMIVDGLEEITLADMVADRTNHTLEVRISNYGINLGNFVITSLSGDTFEIRFGHNVREFTRR